MTNKEKLYQLHDETCATAKQIMLQKNADYTAGSDDPYANFRGGEEFGVEPEIGLMIRMKDKMKRVQSFVNLGSLQVDNESVEDACNDLVNYAILLKGLLRERSEKMTKAR